MSELTTTYEWKNIPWRKLERIIFKLQKRIYQASQRGNVKLVHKLQRLLLTSKAAKTIAVRRVSQDNQGKVTAGVDGVSSLTPALRLELVKNLKLDGKAKPTTRVWIPKLGKEKKRPLGIPTIKDRATQCLVKMALEPEWEAKFEPHSYGFRPGRSVHDAVQKIFTLMRKPKYVLDADIEKCFDRINHQALLSKINTSPKVRRQIKSWLKAGVMEGKMLFPTEEGTPQGGVISPILANIALHGLEQAINEGTPNYWYNKETKKSQRTRKPFLVRYAEDFVILHEDLEVVKKCQLIVEEQLSKIGLRLKEEKTKLVHTLDSFNSRKAGFDFLGFNFRQYQVNPGHAQKDTKGNITNHATYIKPSKEAVKKHLSQLRSIIKEGVSLPQKALIDKLGTVILGWSRYYSAACSKEIFTYCDHVLTHMLLSWAYHRHPNKGNKWCVSKYWDIKNENEWSFKDVASGHTLMKHAKMPIRRYKDVIVNKSPYDGDWVYWSKRQGSYPTVEKRTGKLLKAQVGKCSFCGLYFKEADVIELDHRIPRSCGGKDDYSNWQLLHRHCHHQKTASDGSQRGVCDKHLITEEPDEVKVSRPVLKPSQTGDCLA